MAEVLQGRGLGESTFRPQVSDAQGLFQRQAGGHDLAKQTRHLFTVQRPGIARQDLAQDLGLAFRTVKRRGIAAVLQCGDRLGAGRALVDQGLDLFIQGIDTIADRFQFVFAHHANSE